MAANKLQASSVNTSIRALMDVMGDTVMPKLKDMQAVGWVTAAQYAEAIGLTSPCHVRTMLKKNKDIEQATAKSTKGPVLVFRPKRKNNGA